VRGGRFDFQQHLQFRACYSTPASQESDVMARPTLSIPTPAEQRALNFIHQHGSATVREYLANGKHPESRAYTSVMSLLSVMYEKGLVTRSEEGRAFRYKPVLTQAQLREQIVRGVLENVFEGDAEAFKASVAGLKGGKNK
jgi:BlaI family transcriptional regulator, penicillinase repressor